MTPPPSRIRRLFRHLVNTAFDVALVLAVLYAFVNAVTHMGTVPPKPRGNPEQNYLQALLFASSKRADVYNFQDKRDEDFAFFDQGVFSVTDKTPGFFIDKETMPPIRREMTFQQAGHSLSITPALVSQGFQDTFSLNNDRNVLIRSGTGVSLYITDEAQLYFIRDVQEESIVAFDQNQLRLLTTEREGDKTFVVVHYPSCARESRLLLTDHREDITSSLHRYSLPVQRTLKFSPSQNRVAALDHTALPRIVSFDLLLQSAEMLSVPFLGEHQWHFSPVFLDDNTLAFSAIDGARWMTVAYNVATKQYRALSPQFSDQIFVSNGEKPVLVQSIFAEGGQNVPFGSRALYRERGTIARDAVGDLLEADLPWRLLFEESGSTLRFRPSLSADDFSSIEDPQQRVKLRALWTEMVDFETAAQTLTLVLRQEEGTFKVLSRTSLTVKDGASYPLYLRDVSSLLEALEVPVNAQRQYASRRKELLRSGEEYVLIGSFR